MAANNKVVFFIIAGVVVLLVFIGLAVFIKPPTTPTTAAATQTTTPTTTAATTTTPSATTPPPNEWYLHPNNGVCSPGSSIGPWLGTSAFDRVSANAFGVTFCNGVPQSRPFYLHNGVECPSGTVKLGWVRDDAMDHPSPKQTFGLTVCQGPAGYANPSKIRLSGNGDCSDPNFPTKIGWIKDSKLDKSNLTGTNAGTGTKFDSWGIAVCHKDPFAW